MVLGGRGDAVSGARQGARTGAEFLRVTFSSVNCASSAAQGGAAEAGTAVAEGSAVHAGGRSPAVSRLAYRIVRTCTGSGAGAMRGFVTYARVVRPRAASNLSPMLSRAKSRSATCRALLPMDDASSG